jgi:hypothetical protein
MTFRYIRLLTFGIPLIASFIQGNAQCLQAVSAGQTEYNVVGSGGIPFDTLPGSGHWNNYGHGCSDLFVSKNYSFAIPAGAHILGIQVLCDVVIHDLTDSSIILLKHGVPYGTDGATHIPIIAAGTISWGDTTTLWGGTWAAADFNDSDFGVQFRVRDIRPDSVFGWYDANPVYIVVAYDTLVHSAVSGGPYPESSIRIYPNPATTNVLIDFGRPVQNAGIILRNAIGQVVREIPAINTTTRNLDVTNLPRGLYALETTAAGIRTMQQIILE